MDSILCQTYQNLEIICVDDGSTDGTLSVLRRYESNHSKKIRVLTGPNGGAPAARNRGLNLANGEWIQFMDADDLLLPNKIAHQITLLRRSENNIGFLVAGSNVRHMDAPPSVQTPRLVVPRDPWVALSQSRIGNTCSNLWRRVAVACVDGWREDMPRGQEADLMFRILKTGMTVTYDREIHTLCRRRPGSLCTTNPVTGLRIAIELRARILEHLLTSALATSERRAAALNSAFRHIRTLSILNPAAAVCCHQNVIPQDYRPQKEAGARIAYRVAYAILGFKRTEQVYRMLRRVIPRGERTQDNGPINLALATMGYVASCSI
ncbi:MAG: glycosyltransferase [Pirellulales bacterium]|nr:glycosyltransferase [Pirellulales bacterium]